MKKTLIMMIIFFGLLSSTNAVYLDDDKSFEILSDIVNSDDGISESNLGIYNGKDIISNIKHIKKVLNKDIFLSFNLKDKTGTIDIDLKYDIENKDKKIFIVLKNLEVKNNNTKVLLGNKKIFQLLNTLEKNEKIAINLEEIGEEIEKKYNLGLITDKDYNFSKNFFKNIIDFGGTINLNNILIKKLIKENIIKIKKNDNETYKIELNITELNLDKMIESILLVLYYQNLDNKENLENVNFITSNKGLLLKDEGIKELTKLDDVFNKTRNVIHLKDGKLDNFLLYFKGNIKNELFDILSLGNLNKKDYSLKSTEGLKDGDEFLFFTKKKIKENSKLFKDLIINKNNNEDKTIFFLLGLTKNNYIKTDKHGFKINNKDKILLYKDASTIISKAQSIFKEVLIKEKYKKLSIVEKAYFLNKFENSIGNILIHIKNQDFLYFLLELINNEKGNLLKLGK